MPFDRRQFIQSSSLTGLALGFPGLLSAQPPGAGKLKIGLIGCGGRGTGAASQALKADPDNILWAVADVFEPRAESTLKRLSQNPAYGVQVQVAPMRRFIGLDAYEKAIAECDVLLLTAPPAFRPRHLRAVVEAGKHAFAEKPVAIDMAGIKSVLDSARMAQKTGSKLQHGFTWRFAPGMRAAMERIHKGEIGKIVSLEGSYLAAPPKPMLPAAQRAESSSDIEWQIRNWLNFRWLSGGPLVEQAIHTIDKVSWALQDIEPLAAVATGGRNRGEDGGDIFDHFSVRYEFPGGIFAHVDQRQATGTYQEVRDRIHGTRGTLIGPDKPVILTDQRWRYRHPEGEEENMYQVCINEFFAAIRSGAELNTGEYMAKSSALGILGREAAYSGQRITWQELWNSDQSLVPDPLNWDAAHEPAALPQPGIYTFS